MIFFVWFGLSKIERDENCTKFEHTHTHRACGKRDSSCVCEREREGGMDGWTEGGFLLA